MFNARLVKFGEMVTSIEPVEVEDYKDISKYLECSYFDVVAQDNEVSIFVDDEGLLKSDNIVTAFTLNGKHFEGLAGHLLIAGGIDDEGETLDVPKSLDMVEFLDSIKVLGFTR